MPWTAQWRSPTDSTTDLWAVAVSPDGHLVSSRSNEIELLDLSRRRLLHRWRELARVFAVAYLVAQRRHDRETERIVAVAGKERIIRLRDPRGVEIRQPLVGHTEPISALAAVPGDEGYLLSGSDDRTLRLCRCSRRTRRRPSHWTSPPSGSSPCGTDSTSPSSWRGSR